MRLREFIDELSERRVYRATAVYVVAVFALWQAADIAIPALGLPQSVMRYLVGGALLGFPVVVVLSWIYDLRVDGPVGFDRRIWRAIGAGLVAMVVLALGLNLVRRQAGPTAPRVTGLPFEMGVEDFFGGNLRSAEAIFSSIASDRSDPDGNQRDALRYLVRIASLSGERDRAMDAVRRLLALEPPIALMAPAVETDSVMALYYDARRERLGAAAERSEPSPIAALEVFAFVNRTSGTDTGGVAEAEPGSSDSALRALGEGIATALATDLVGRLGGIKVVERSVVAGERGFELYRYLESPAAARIIKPTHLVFGSVAGEEGGRMLLSAWVFDAATGRRTHSAQALGSWSDVWTILARLTDDLIAQITDETR
jgi:hypothetical protein